MRSVVLVLVTTVGCDHGLPCDLDTFGVATSGETESGDGDGDPGDGDGDGDSCPFVPDGWPPAPVACRVLSCWQDMADPDGPIDCEAIIHVEAGHPGQLSISGSGSGQFSWNEAPWNVDGGTWEDADFVGSGSECGWISLNSAAIGPDSMNERYFDLICDDFSLGLFSSSRVYLTPNGPIVEP
jgi:hypothetical protein